MITTLKIRLEPNNKQNSLMLGSAGASRWAYNYTLAKQEESYKLGGKFISDNDIRKTITQIKQTSEFSWLNNYSNNIPKQAVKDACEAYKKFFKKIADKPKFKSKKKSKPAFYQDTAKIKFTNTHVRVEKVGWVKLSEYGRIPIDCKYTNPRVVFEGLYWYITVGVEIIQAPTELTGESIGIDLGIKDLAIVSSIDKPFKNINKTAKVKKIQKRLARLQRQVSKKYIKNKKGGSYTKTNNIIKLEKEINKLHVKLKNIRTDYRHKTTTAIVKTKPSRIVMESLNVKGMLKNKHLSKTISEQGFYEFKMFMQYKCNRNSIQFIEADRWYPSSKTCSCCGHVKPKLSLSQRTFICEECGLIIDRDKNASINLALY